MNKEKAVRFDCARVDWVDSNAFSKWHPRTDENNQPSACVSIGMIEKEDDNAITIRMSIDLILDNIDGTITIPKCSVKGSERFKG
jgi:hypothetical protein